MGNGVGPAKHAFDYVKQQLHVGDAVAFPVCAEAKAGLDDGVVVEITGINAVTVAKFGGETFELASRYTIKIGK